MLKKIFKSLKMLWILMNARERIKFVPPYMYVLRSVYFASKPRISANKKLTIKDKCYIGFNCHIGVDLIIEQEVLIASNVSFVGDDHDFSNPNISIYSSGRILKPRSIIIRKGAWIGHGAIILAGVEIGENSIVAAGSIVTKSVADYAIVGGNPARIIKFRDVDTP